MHRQHAHGTYGTTVSEKPEGPVLAAVVAAGIGAATLGVLTVLAEAMSPIEKWLTFSDPVGPLSGEAATGVAGWLTSWVVLHAVLRGKRHITGSSLVMAFVLIGFGVIGTFPAFYRLFAAE